MKNATLRDIGVTPFYWLMGLGFGGFGFLAVEGVRWEPESKTLLIGCGLFFFSISFLSLMWPVMRLREAHGVRFVLLKSDLNNYEGILVPTSKAKILILAIGCTLFMLGGLFLFLSDSSWENKLQAGLAFVGYLFIGVRWLKKGWGLERGILLAKDNIVWHQPPLPPVCIPWQEIAVANACHIREQYGTASAFGILVSNPEKITSDKNALRKLQENYHRKGWHFYYYAEGLLLSTLTIQSTVIFYLVYPEKRNELANGAAIARIEQFDREGEN